MRRYAGGTGRSAQGTDFTYERPLTELFCTNPDVLEDKIRLSMICLMAEVGFALVLLQSETDIQRRPAIADR